MKAIVVNRQPGMEMPVPPSIAIVPSSAIIPDSKPLFLPSFSEIWNIIPVIAFRLSRLGKSIGEQFASRYYDAVVPALLVKPLAFNGRHELAALGFAFDGALVSGSVSELSSDGNYTIGCRDIEIKLTGCHDETDHAIATLSRYMTMQMGDLLISAISDISVSVTTGDNISLALNGNQEALGIRIR